MRHATLFGVCVIAASVSAQSVVFPSDHATIPNGSTYTYSLPFSSNAPFRCQIIYDEWDLGLAPGTPITRIGFRQDGSTNSPTQQIVVEISMAASSASSTTMSTTFASNYIGTPTVVHPQGLFTLPALNSTSTGAPVWVDLPTSYTYTGGNLLIEFKVFLNDNGNNSFSYRLDRATYVSPRTAGVPGCQHSGGQAPVFYNNPVKVGGNWTFAVQSAPNNTPILLCIAASQQLVAPYSLTAIGLDPSCQGQLPASFSPFAATTNGSGYKSWSVPVPNSVVFNDTYMTSQVVAFDWFSQGQLVVSNAEQVQFGIDPAMSVLYAANDANAATGTRYSNYGIVTLFN